MTWNEDEKYPRGWENESVYPLSSSRPILIIRLTTNETPVRSVIAAVARLFPRLFHVESASLASIVKQQQQDYLTESGNGWLHVLCKFFFSSAR